MLNGLYFADDLRYRLRHDLFNVGEPYSLEHLVDIAAVRAEVVAGDVERRDVVEGNVVEGARDGELFHEGLFRRGICAGHIADVGHAGQVGHHIQFVAVSAGYDLTHRLLKYGYIAVKVFVAVRGIVGRGHADDEGGVVDERGLDHRPDVGGGGLLHVQFAGVYLLGELRLFFFDKFGVALPLDLLYLAAQLAEAHYHWLRFETQGFGDEPFVFADLEGGVVARHHIFESGTAYIPQLLHDLPLAALSEKEDVGASHGVFRHGDVVGGLHILHDLERRRLRADAEVVAHELGV